MLSTFPGKDGPFLCITEVMDFVLQFQSVTGLVVSLVFTFTARLVAVQFEELGLVVRSR